MGTKQPPKNTAPALDQKIIQGLGKYFAKVKTMTVDGTTYTPTELKAVFQAEIDALTALDTVTAQYRQQVADTRTARAKAIEVRTGLRAYVLATYGKAAVQMLGDFGMTAPKQSKRTAVATADAVTQALATRKARRAAAKSVAPAAPDAPPTAAQASTPAHVVQAPAAAPVAAPAANSAQSN